MDRRSFLKASPVFPVATVTAALVLREEGQDVGEFDVSVLKTQPGDVIVLTAPGGISDQQAARLTACWEHHFPQLKVVVMSDGLKVDGVIRQ